MRSGAAWAEVERLWARVYETQAHVTRWSRRAAVAEARVRDLEAAGDKLADTMADIYVADVHEQVKRTRAVSGWLEARRA